MFRTLRARLLLTYLIVVGLALAVVAVGLLLFLINNPLVERQLYRDLRLIATVLTTREERPVLPRDRILPALRGLGLADTRVLVLTPHGEVIEDTRPEEPLPGADALAQIVAQAPAEARFRDFEGGVWLYVSRPTSRRTVLVVAVRRPAARAVALFADDLLLPMLQAGAVALLTAVLLAVLIARWVAGPLQRMAAAARSVAQGHYQQMRVEGPEEVQGLARAFNEMVAQVRASQQSMRDFVANVSHELKTPLTSIQGFAQAILDGTAREPEDQRRAAQVIYAESDRLRRLVEDLLDLARMEAGQVEFRRLPVDLTVLVRGVLERLRLRAEEKGVELVNGLDSLPLVIGDGDRLAQVFTNLVDNAIQHTPPGGQVRVRGWSQAGWVAVAVEDTGPGIPPEDLSRIFERFYQVDKARPGGGRRGVGLGLAISREIVQAHGGRLAAQSEMGQGSRFTVQLPITRPDDPTLAQEGL